MEFAVLTTGEQFISNSRGTGNSWWR